MRSYRNVRVVLATEGDLSTGSSAVIKSRLELPGQPPIESATPIDQLRRSSNVGARWSWRELCLAAIALDQGISDTRLDHHDLVTALGELLLPEADRLIELHARCQPSQGVRLCLSFDDDELRQIPWEFAGIEGSGPARVPLVRRPGFSIVRAVHIPGDSSHAPTDGAERPSPRDLVRVSVLRGPRTADDDIEAMKSAVGDKPVLLSDGWPQAGADIVLISAHGAVGQVLLDDPGDPRGDGTWWTAEELARPLLEAGARVVIVNSCRSGEATDRTCSLAEKLCAAGIPAVVGMSMRAEEGHLAAFTRGFSLRLFAPGGASIDEAVAAGRRAACEGPDPVADIAPALFRSDTSDRPVLVAVPSRNLPRGRARTLLDDDGPSEEFIAQSTLLKDLLPDLERFRAGTDQFLTIEGRPGTGRSTLLRMLERSGDEDQGPPVAAALLWDPRLRWKGSRSDRSELVQRLAEFFHPYADDWPTYERRPLLEQPIENLRHQVTDVLMTADPQSRALVLIDDYDLADELFRRFIEDAADDLQHWLGFVCVVQQGRGRPRPPSGDCIRLAERRAQADLLRYAGWLGVGTSVYADPQVLDDLVDGAAGCFSTVREAVERARDSGDQITSGLVDAVLDARLWHESTPMRKLTTPGAKIDQLPDWFSDGERHLEERVKQFATGDGRVLLIQGPPGSGKSTLLRHLEKCSGRNDMPHVALSLLEDPRLDPPDPVTAKELFRHLAASLRDEIELPLGDFSVSEAIRDAVTAIERFLRDQPDPRRARLILVDGVDPDQVDQRPTWKAVVEASQRLDHWVKFVCTTANASNLELRGSEEVLDLADGLELELQKFAEELCRKNGVSGSGEMLLRTAEAANEADGFLGVLKAVEQAGPGGTLTERCLKDPLKTLVEGGRESAQPLQGVLVALSVGPGERGFDIEELAGFGLGSVDEVGMVVDRAAAFLSTDDQGRRRLAHGSYRDTLFKAVGPDVVVESFAQVARGVAGWDSTDPYRRWASLALAVQAFEGAQVVGGEGEKPREGAALVGQLATDHTVIGGMFDRAGSSFVAYQLRKAEGCLSSQDDPSASLVSRLAQAARAAPLRWCTTQIEVAEQLLFEVLRDEEDEARTWCTEWLDALRSEHPEAVQLRPLAWTSTPGALPEIYRHALSATALAVLEDGRIVTSGFDASGQSELCVWRPDDPSVASLTVPLEYVPIRLDSPGGDRVVMLDDGGVARLWELDEPLPAPVAAGGEVRALAASSGHLALGGADGRVQLLPLDSSLGEPSFEVLTGLSVRTMAITQDRRVAVAGMSEDGSERLQLWVLGRTKPDHEVVLDEPVNSLASLGGGSVVGATRSTAFIWEPSSSDRPALRTLRQRLDRHRDHLAPGAFLHRRDFPICVAVLPGDLVAVGTVAGIIEIWDPAWLDEPLALVLHGPPVGDLAATPDGGLVSISWKGDVRHWREGDWRSAWVEESGQGLRSVVSTPDGGVFTLSVSGRGSFWAGQGAPTWIKPDNGRGASAVAVLEDGRVVTASARGLGTVVWDPRDPHRPDMRLRHRQEVVSIAPADAQRLVTVDAEGCARIWNIRRHRARRRVHPPDGFPLPFAFVFVLVVLLPLSLFIWRPTYHVRGGHVEVTYPLGLSEAVAIFIGGALALVLMTACAGIAVGLFRREMRGEGWRPWRITRKPAGQLRHDKPIRQVAGSSRGTVATLDADGDVHLWDLDHPAAPLARLPSDRSLSSVAEINDDTLATLVEGVVQLWDIAEPAAPGFLMTLNASEGRRSPLTYWLSMPVVYVAAAGDHHVVTVSWLGAPAVRLWDLRDRVRPHRACVFTGAPAVSLDSTTDGFFTGFRDGTYVRWAVLSSDA